MTTQARRDALTIAPAEELGRLVYETLEAGESDARLLDGKRHKRDRWELARAALFELLRRVERAS